MESEKLMPCPFCGGGATFEKGKDEQGTEYVYVECQSCYARSDGWYTFDGEENAEKVAAELWNRRSAMTTSEPTTGEIVRALRNGGAYFNLGTIAADRLESQEATIAALTARAEKAEAREKAAVKDIEAIMSSRGLTDYTICEFCRRPDDDTCFIPNDANKCAAVWRGLPQEGEGK